MFDVIGVLKNTIKDVRILFIYCELEKDVNNDGGSIKKHVNACQEACTDTKKKLRDIDTATKCVREK